MSHRKRGRVVLVLIRGKDDSLKMTQQIDVTPESSFIVSTRIYKKLTKKLPSHHRGSLYVKIIPGQATSCEIRINYSFIIIMKELTIMFSKFNPPAKRDPRPEKSVRPD